jgi:uncharacterized protein
MAIDRLGAPDHIGDHVGDHIGDRRRVAVAYVGVTEQFLRSLEVAPGTRLRAAIEQSGVLAKCPEIDLALYKVGVYGKLQDLDRVLEDGERVEIYRPLIADPRQARKRRAEEGRPLRKGGD